MKQVAALARGLLGASCERIGIGGLRRRYRERARALVLMYHRVLEERGDGREVEPGMFVTRRTFELHLRHLTQSYTLVTIDQLGEWMKHGGEAGRPLCALTFDDGWCDNYAVAFPLLQSFNAPATVFLVTGTVGAADMMTWAQAREMERCGITFGSHTVTHPELDTCDAPRIRAELKESKETLEQELTTPSGWFCYPKGAYNEVARRLTAEYYSGAVTVRRAWVRRGGDALAVPRVGVHDDVSRTRGLFAWRLLSAR